MPQNWDWKAENQLSAEYWYGDNKEALASVDRSSEDIYGETGIWYLANHTPGRIGYQQTLGEELKQR